MDEQKELKLIQTIYDRIYDVVTYSPGNNKPAFEPKSSLVQVVPLGLPINPADFRNATTPLNPNGSLLAAEVFSRFVDLVPGVSADFAATTRRVTDIYGSVVTLANTTEVPDPAAVERYNRAYAFLNQTVEITGWDGTKTTQVQPTAIYAAYNRNRQAYVTALSAYRTAYLNYNLEIPAEQRMWQAQEPMLRLAVDTTYDTWRSQGATQVEDAIAVMDHSINLAVARILQDAKREFDISQLAGQTLGGAPWHLAYALPSNWIDPAADNFTRFSVRTSYLNTSADSKFTRYGGGASFRWGLWNVGGSFENQEREQFSHTDANDLEISMETAVVQLFRPWMNGAIFGMGGWHMGDAYPKGGISTGDLNTATINTAMPLLPNAFVVARNIKIKGDWSSEDRSKIEKILTTSAGGGWGPFQLRGSYTNSESHETFTSRFENGELTLPGMQVVAWVSNVVPLSPPEGKPVVATHDVKIEGGQVPA